MTSPPLAGLRILDLSTVVAAPVASTLLADFGAEVVKIELPGKAIDALRAMAPHVEGPDGQEVPLWWKVANRNKRGITLDIRTEEGAGIFRRLISRFDVLVENCRPGTLARWGFSKEVLEELNPGLIVLRVSGYGQTGPMAGHPGFARVAEAYAGFTALAGHADGLPMHVGYPVADGITGLYGALGILVACMRKKDHPDVPGEEIDLSLAEAMLRFLDFTIIEVDQTGQARQRMGSRNPYAGPSNVYGTADGRWCSISASSQSVFERLARAMGRPDLIDDERFASNQARLANIDAIDTIVADWMGAHTQAECVAVFEAEGIAGGPVNDAADLMACEHLAERGAIVRVDAADLGSVAMQGVVPVLRDAPGRVERPGPGHGEHTDEVLSELLDLPPAELTALRQKGVI